MSKTKQNDNVKTKKNKKLSTFLDFNIKKDKHEIDNKNIETKESSELGFTNERAKSVPKSLVYVCCPLCGNHHKLTKNGGYARSRMKRRSAKLRQELSEQLKGKLLIRSRAKIYNKDKELFFNRIDLKEGPFFSIRKAGRGIGFPEIGIIPFTELDKLDESNKIIATELVRQIYFKCTEILKVIDELNL